MDIQKHLLSWEEYNKVEFSTPYIFRIEKDTQSLVYIGAKHSFDPEDKQFGMIREEFEKFSKAEGTKVVVLEGGDGWETEETEEETIKRYGEPAFTKQLAMKAGIEYISPEPTKTEMDDFIKTKFTEEEIVYYTIAQQSLHYKNMRVKQDKDDFIQTRINNDIKRLSDKYTTPEDIKKLHKKLFNTDFDLNDEGHFYEIVNPAMFKGRFNELARERNILRDTKIVQSILDYWNRGYSVFVVYGSGHALIQEPALKEFAK